MLLFFQDSEESLFTFSNTTKVITEWMDLSAPQKHLGYEEL